MNVRTLILATSAFLMIGSGCDFGQSTGGGTGVEGISGQLVDPSGHPVEGAWVKAYPVNTLTKRNAIPQEKSGAHMPVADSVRTNATGRFNIPGLAKGTYTIVATSALHSADSIYSLILSAIIIQGDTNIGTDTLRLSGSVTIKVQDGNVPVSGAQCSAVGTPFESVTDSSGNCLLKNLPPGEFEIVVTQGGLLVGGLGALDILSGVNSNKGVLDITNGSPSGPPAPAVLSPANGTTLYVDDSIYWTSSPGATSYLLQIGEVVDQFFANPVITDSTVLGTSWRIGALREGIIYRWRVRGRNDSGFGPWSITRFFVMGGSTQLAPYFKIESTTVALWTFDSITPSNQYPDVSGRGNHLPAPSQATLSTSPYGKSATFNGSKSVMTGKPDLSLAGHAILTYEARIWLDEYPSSTLFNGGSTLLGQYAGLKLIIDHQGRIQAAAQTGSGSSWRWYPPITAVGAVPLGRWVNVAVAAVRDSSILYSYIDGVAQQTYVNYPLGAVLRPSSSSEFPFVVGNDDRDAQAFPGRFDEIRISNDLVLGRGTKPIVGPVPGL